MEAQTDYSASKHAHRKLCAATVPVTRDFPQYYMHTTFSVELWGGSTLNNCMVHAWQDQYPQQLYGPCLARPVVWSNWHTCLQLHSEMEPHVQSMRNYCFSGHSHAATVLNEMGQPAVHIAACNHVHPTLSIHL